MYQDQEEEVEEKVGNKNFVYGNNLAPCEQLKMRLDLLRLKTYAHKRKLTSHVCFTH